MNDAVTELLGVQSSIPIHITYIEFAYYVTVLGDSPAAMQAIINRIIPQAAKVGLKTGKNKTKTSPLSGA